MKCPKCGGQLFMHSDGERGVCVNKCHVATHSGKLETLEDVIRETEMIGEVEHENGIDHIWNVVINIDDGIGNGDTYRILDFLVMCWEHRKGFEGQPEHYKRFVHQLLDFRDKEEDSVSLVKYFTVGGKKTGG